MGHVPLGDRVGKPSQEPNFTTMMPTTAVVVGDATGDNSKHMGMYGHSISNTGVYCASDELYGLYAKGGTLAAWLDGNVEVDGNLVTKGNVDVTGDIHLTNADCAEDFDIAEVGTVEPGTVMVLGEEGALHPSSLAYDKRVAGVISGAGQYKPGIVLDKQHSSQTRMPVALLGKVFCKVDAHYGSVEVGDLLTTSPTSGHAMKASDPQRAFGCVIGKALRPLADGQGLIPILIALQ